MKYLICGLPMLLCVEIVSIICLLALVLCFVGDIIKAREVSK